MKKYFVFLICVLSSLIFADPIVPGSLFQDKAVFQRNVVIPVWGKAKPGSTLYAEFAGQKLSALVNDAGEFMFRFAPVEAGGPYTLKISDPKEKTSVTLKDILVGEVWVASGQSNMNYCLGSDWEVPKRPAGVPGKVNRQQEREFIAGIKKPGQMRFFHVPLKCPGTRESTVNGRWEYVDAKNAPRVSAAAAWFGKYIQEKLNVPVGLITTSWGGTRVEAWTSREGLLSNPDTAAMIREWDQILQDPEIWDFELAKKKSQKAFQRQLVKDPGNKGFGLGYAKSDFNDSSWKSMKVPGSWIVQKISGNGSVWVRKTIEIPREFAGQEMILETGGIDKHDITYFNGVEVGRTGKEFETDHWDIPRKYIIPAKLVKAGKNVIAIRAFSFIYDGSLNGSNENYKLYPKGSPGKFITLAGMWKAAPEKNFGILSASSGGYGPNKPNSPGILFDSMINPLIPYAIRGAIWYQGESNANTLYNAIAYQKRLETMIRDWRFRWGIGDFPFIQVQLAYYDRKQEGPFLANSNWAHLRESQRLLTETVPNVFMASVIDNGHKIDIHPQDKKTVGKRLAFNALHHVYHDVETVPCGPCYQSYSVEGNKIRVTFRNAAGLKIKGDFRKSFFIGKENGAFYPADELTIEGSSIVLSSKEVESPAAVRYAWSQAPVSTLYNGADLPASSFKTDVWSASK